MSTWVISCNESKYDHRSAFANLQTIDWRQSTNVEAGDIVYIYVGRPISALLYKCRAVAVDIYEPNDDDRPYRIGAENQEQPNGRYMTLCLLERYDDNRFKRKALFEHGLRTVQGPSRVGEDFISYV